MRYLRCFAFYLLYIVCNANSHTVYLITTITVASPCGKAWNTDVTTINTAILNTCQMPSRFYIIPSNVNKSQTHLLKPFIARDLMEGHICMQNTLMFALVFCFELRARAVRTCCHCNLAVKNPIYDGNRGQLKKAKKSWTVPQYGHGTLNCVQMALKQANIEFSSYIFQFTRLHGVAVMQGRTFWNSVVTLFKSARWYVLSGTGFLVAHHIYIGNVMHECKISKSSPHQPCEITCYSNALEISLFWMARAPACF